MRRNGLWKKEGWRRGTRVLKRQGLKLLRVRLHYYFINLLNLEFKVAFDFFFLMINVIINESCFFLKINLLIHLSSIKKQLFEKRNEGSFANG